MTATFVVTPNLEKSPYEPYTLTGDTAMKNLGRMLKAEAFEAYRAPSKVVHAEQMNGLWAAIHHSFCNHVPLGLSPDHIWLCIARTVSEFVGEDPEGLRKRFVNFEGKMQLEVRRDSFEKGSPNNPWENVFAEWSAKIKENTVSKIYDLMVCNFSTTGPVEKAASEIVLMDAMKHYFQYDMTTCCGIPEVTLFGTTDDWAEIGLRLGALTEFEGLAPWAAELQPVILQFVRAAAGNPDIKWWQSFYHYMSMSGSDTITGHFTKFFRNAQVQKKTSWRVPEGMLYMESGDVPLLVSKVPFTWHYLGSNYDMQLVAGVPFAVLEDGMVKPAAAWAVGEAP